MMKLRKLACLFIFIPFMVLSQTVIRGTVYDKNSKKPVSDVIINVLNENNETLAYDIATEQGKFSLSVNTTDKDILLVSRMLGYKDEKMTVENKSQEINVFLEQTSIELKEVTIKSRPINVSEDTLKYSVNTFKSAGDRSIGDILKKLPGIEIDKSGGIKYKGEPINKFYIEGLDLLENKYGIATNNVPVGAVQNVEVIENHQPIKSIKGMIGSAQAAINLKLKNNKMALPIGGMRVGGGYSHGVNWLLELFALQASKKQQSIVMYKTNNIGNDISEELNEQSLSLRNSQEPSSGLQKKIITSSFLDNPPIEQERYLLNQSHVGSLNNLWKTGEDSQIRVNLNYLNDLVTQNKVSESNYFLPGNSINIIENNVLSKRQMSLDGALTYTDNNTRYYVENAIKWKIKKDKNASLFNVNGDIIHQKTDAPYTVIEDNLDYFKKWDDNILNIGTYLAFTHQPEKLIVTKNGRTEMQQVGLSNFYSKTGSYYSWYWGLSSLRLNGALEASLNNLNSALTGTIFTDSLERAFQSKLLKVELTPIYSYTTRKIEFRFALPVNDQLITKSDKNSGTNFSKNYIFINANTSISYTFNAFLSSNLSYRYARNIGDYIDFIDAYLMKNYRNYYKPSGNISLSESQSFTVSLYYRNPLTSLFANGSATYIPMEKNKMIAQRFAGIQSIVADVMMINKSAMWFGQFYLGKYFSGIKTNISLTGDYNNYQAIRLQQNILYPFTSNTLGLILKSNTKISNILTFVYKINYLLNQSIINTSSTKNISSFNQFGQQFKTYFSPTNKLEFDFQLEHSYNELTKNKSLNIFFADMGITYKLKQVDFELNINNIFNKKEYGYSIFDGLDTYTYKYAIRSMSVMLTASFKL